MELAQRLIELCGFRPGDDIPIQIVGLRPGEKMHEELLAEGECVATTPHPRIRVLNTPEPDRALLRARIDDVLAAASVDRKTLIRALKALVPEYEPNNDEFRRWLSQEPRPVRDRTPRT
jgi:FlaA1/EpsC-like NDP-sugar epimerase